MQNQNNKPIKVTPIIPDITKLLKRSAIFALMTSILTLIFGILVLIDPTATLSVIFWTLGIFLIISGLYTIIMYFLNSKNRSLLDNSLLRGVISAIFGIILISSFLETAKLFGIIMGIFIIYDAITRLNIALNLRVANIRSWSTLLIFSLLMLVLGSILIFVPLSILALTGWIIVASGLISLIADILFLIRLKDFTKFLENHQ